MFKKPKIEFQFNDKYDKMPRKLKKKVKAYVGVHWHGMTNKQRLWHYMEYSNGKYKDFLIMKMIDRHHTNKMFGY